MELAVLLLQLLLLLVAMLTGGAQAARLQLQQQLAVVQWLGQAQLHMLQQLGVLLLLLLLLLLQGLALLLLSQHLLQESTMEVMMKMASGEASKQARKHYLFKNPWAAKATLDSRRLSCADVTMWSDA
jgi:hypothetical protein